MPELADSCQSRSWKSVQTVGGGKAVRNNAREQAEQIAGDHDGSIDDGRLRQPLLSNFGKDCEEGEEDVEDKDHRCVHVPFSPDEKANMCCDACSTRCEESCVQRHSKVLSKRK